MTLEDLRECWKQGKPVICPIQEYGVATKQASEKYGHWVVVIGVGLGKVEVFDPSFDNTLEGEDSDASPGEMMIDEDKWMRVWYDHFPNGKDYTRYGIVVSKPGGPHA